VPPDTSEAELPKKKPGTGSARGSASDSIRLGADAG
jgi:hypothetical protein